jgi:hypothetical protein
LILVCGLLLGSVASAAAQRTYAIFIDQDLANGFDGVSADIEVVPASLMNLVGFSVWCGIDSGDPVHLNSWLQTGWRWRTGYAAGQAYYEFVTETGFQSYPIERGIAITGEYKVELSGNSVDFHIGRGGAEASQPFSFFDGRQFCRAAYGAEIHRDPIDHVPGTPTSHCHLWNVQLRVLYYPSWDAAPLAFMPGLADRPSCWNYTYAANNFEIWDKRGLLDIVCPPVAVLAGVTIGSQVRRGPGDSPILVIPESQDRDTLVPAISASVSAEKLLGSYATQTGPAQLVQFRDRSPFGTRSEGLGWLFRSTVDVANADSLVQIGLNIIVDADNGGVVAVYSDPSDSWVLPIDEPRNPEITTALDGWVMGSKVPESMASTAVEAISAVWREFGLNPTRVGQLVARPRWISAQFPAQRIGGNLVPLRPTEKVWLVEVCGVKFNETESNGILSYQTGKVMQYQDGTLKYMGGVFVP